MEIAVTVLILVAVVAAVYFARKDKKRNSLSGQDYREVKGISGKHRR